MLDHSHKSGRYWFSVALVLIFIHFIWYYWDEWHDDSRFTYIGHLDRTRVFGPLPVDNDHLDVCCELLDEWVFDLHPSEEGGKFGIERGELLEYGKVMDKVRKRNLSGREGNESSTHLGNSDSKTPEVKIVKKYIDNDNNNDITNGNSNTKKRAFIRELDFTEVDHPEYREQIACQRVDKKDYMFVDLGSGRGKVCLRALDRYGCRSVGIEICSLSVQRSLEKLASQLWGVRRLLGSSDFNPLMCNTPFEMIYNSILFIVMKGVEFGYNDLLNGGSTNTESESEDSSATETVNSEETTQPSTQPNNPTERLSFYQILSLSYEKSHLTNFYQNYIKHYYWKSGLKHSITFYKNYILYGHRRPIQDYYDTKREFLALSCEEEEEFERDYVKKKIDRGIYGSAGNGVVGGMNSDGEVMSEGKVVMKERIRSIKKELEGLGLAESTKSEEGGGSNLTIDQKKDGFIKSLLREKGLIKPRKAECGLPSEELVKKVNFHHVDFSNVDLRGADVVYMFLAKNLQLHVVEEVLPKSGLRRGAKLITVGAPICLSTTKSHYYDHTTDYIPEGAENSARTPEELYGLKHLTSRTVKHQTIYTHQIDLFEYLGPPTKKQYNRFTDLNGGVGKKSDRKEKIKEKETDNDNINDIDDFPDDTENDFQFQENVISEIEGYYSSQSRYEAEVDSEKKIHTFIEVGDGAEYYDNLSKNGKKNGLLYGSSSNPHSYERDEELLDPSRKKKKTIGAFLKGQTGDIDVQLKKKREREGDRERMWRDHMSHAYEYSDSIQWRK